MPALLSRRLELQHVEAVLVAIFTLDQSVGAHVMGGPLASGTSLGVYELSTLAAVFPPRQTHGRILALIMIKMTIHDPFGW